MQATQAVALVGLSRLLFGRSLYFKLASDALLASQADSLAAATEGAPPCPCPCPSPCPLCLELGASRAVCGRWQVPHCVTGRRAARAE